MSLVEVVGLHGDTQGHLPGFDTPIGLQHDHEHSFDFHALPIHLTELAVVEVVGLQAFIIVMVGMVVYTAAAAELEGIVKAVLHVVYLEFGTPEALAV